jgi:prepilin-type N-terminal cleavage/methylation domain-containing protein
MNSCSKTRKFSAYTLIELLVSITIISIIAGLSITSYPKFAQQLEVTTETYKMLGYFRETQSYGVSAVSTPGVKFVYGVQVNMSNNTIKRLILESPTDNTNDYYINNAKQDTNFDSLVLKSGFEIFKICGDDTCDTSLDQAYAFFKRPNPEARLTGQTGNITSPDKDASSFDRITIYVRSKITPAFIKKIVILQTGQMYVNDW